MFNSGCNVAENYTFCVRNVLLNGSVNHTMLLQKTSPGALMLLLALFFSDCKKASENDAAVFYGTWVKGPAIGDTLNFYRKDGKNILAYNLSFNATVPAPTEIEYSYTNGKLHLHYSAEPLPINSFEWKQRGREFELLGFELFLFMSSTLTRFNYHKIE